MAEIEKEAWEQIKSRSLGTPIDPRVEKALEAACLGNGLLDRSGDLGAEPSFMPLATEEDLAYVLAGGGWSPGTGFVYEDLAFMEQARDEWAAFTSDAPKGDGARAWEQFESMGFEALSAEEAARTVNALAIATPEERLDGGWYELLDALDGRSDLHWEHSSSLQVAFDGTLKTCRSLHAEGDNLTISVYERPSFPGWAVDVNEGPIGDMRRVVRSAGVERLPEALSLADRQASEYVIRAACPAWNSPFLTDALRQELYDNKLVFKRPDGRLPDGLGVWTDAHGWLSEYVPETKGKVIDESTGQVVMSWDGSVYSDPITGELRVFDAGEEHPSMLREDAEAVLAGALELDPTLGGKLPAPGSDEHYLGYGNRADRLADANEARFSISDSIAVEAPLETGLVSVSSDQGYVSVELGQWDRMRADMQDAARASGADDPGMYTMAQWAARGEAARAALKEAKPSREGEPAKSASKSPASAKANAETAAAARNGQSRNTERANPTR